LGLIGAGIIFSPRAAYKSFSLIEFIKRKDALDLVSLRTHALRNRLFHYFSVGAAVFVLPL
jgi:hypothetical protein